MGWFVARLGPGGPVAGRAGRQAAVNMACQACSHGQRRGRWMRSLRAERAMRPGTVMSWARIVAVVALAWNFEARVPVARVRLNAIAARTVHALSAANDADGMCASGPAFKSEEVCSTIAWSRWVASAASIDSLESVKPAW